jgi:pyoverdine/dityrosine biosynthesis protein Dit1
MRDICPHQSPEEVRNLISHMSPSSENFHEILSKDQKLQEDVIVLTQRLAFELALLPFTQSDIVKIGLQETHTSLQYSNFLKPFRPEETIACSVHYQKNPNRKIGLKLSDSCITPWHGVLVETDGNFAIEHLKDVNKDHYRKVLNTVNGFKIAHLQKL